MANEDWGWQGRTAKLRRRGEYVFRNKAIPADIVFRAKNKEGEMEEISAHRVLLAMGSDVFEKLLFGSDMETVHHITVVNHKAEVFRLALEYLYSDRTPDMTAENAMDVLKCAEEYHIADLVVKCQVLILQELRTSGVVNEVLFAVAETKISASQEKQTVIVKADTGQPTQQTLLSAVSPQEARTTLSNDPNHNTKMDNQPPQVSYNTGQQTRRTPSSGPPQTARTTSSNDPNHNTGGGPGGYPPQGQQNMQNKKYGMGMYSGQFPGQMPSPGQSVVTTLPPLAYFPPQMQQRMPQGMPMQYGTSPGQAGFFLPPGAVIPPQFHNQAGFLPSQSGAGGHGFLLQQGCVSPNIPTGPAAGPPRFTAPDAVLVPGTHVAGGPFMPRSPGVGQLPRTHWRTEPLFRAEQCRPSAPQPAAAAAPKPEPKKKSLLVFTDPSAGAAVDIPVKEEKLKAAGSTGADSSKSTIRQSSVSEKAEEAACRIDSALQMQAMMKNGPDWVQGPHGTRPIAATTSPIAQQARPVDNVSGELGTMAGRQTYDRSQLLSLLKKYKQGDMRVPDDLKDNGNTIIKKEESAGQDRRMKSSPEVDSKPAIVSHNTSQRSGIFVRAGGDQPMVPNARGPVDATHTAAQQNIVGIDPSNLAKANPEDQKLMLGEELYPLIDKLYPDYAGKVTGMLLEMDYPELLLMLEHPDELKSKVDEAVQVLKTHLKFR